MKHMSSEERKALELALAQIERELGKGTVIRLGKGNIEPWPAISTGAINLDAALGIGGLPRGRIVEIFGPESSGKTTLALSVVASAQQEDFVCAYVDAEHSLDPEYMIAVGVDIDELLLSQPNSGEQALQVVDRLIKTNEVGVIVVDSVPALVTQAELDGEIGDSSMASQARLMSQAMRSLAGKAAKSKTLVIFINQLREKIGVFYGNPEVQPGGRALKFYSSVRIDIRKKEDLKDKTGGVTGLRSKVKIIKNKLGPAYRLAEFDIVYGKGINGLGCLLDLAIDLEIIKRSGSWISYEETPLGQGRDKAIEHLASDMEFTERLTKQVLERYGRY